MESKLKFTINNILLIESNFTRKNIINFKNGLHTNTEISVNVPEDLNENQLLVVELNVKVTGKERNDDGFSLIENSNPFDFSVKMSGIFSINLTKEAINNDIELKNFYNSFGKVNGPSIIFPFIREHISTITAKAGLGNILLNPFNFTTILDSTE